jgi:hypothetical protein
MAHGMAVGAGTGSFRISNLPGMVRLLQRLPDKENPATTID